MTPPWRRASLALAKRTPVRPVRSRLARPIASITFDDVPRSATEAGAETLERAGVAGSFYVCGAHTDCRFEGKTQHSLEDLRRLARAGHEIGSHGYAHLDATRVGTAELRRDHAANLAFVAGEVRSETPRSFAYPFGATSLRAKRFYSERFQTCRGVLSGVNAGWVDLAELRAVLVSSLGFDAGRLQRLAARARRSAGWLIFFTHDVSSDPSPHGCRPEDLETLISVLDDAGVEILPVQAAASLVLGESRIGPQAAWAASSGAQAPAGADNSSILSRR